VLKLAYTEERAFYTFLITVIMLHVAMYGDVVCRSQNRFSENEHFKHQLAEMLMLVPFTAKLSVLCPMFIGVLFSSSL
jgi:hypothetical protein